MIDLLVANSAKFFYSSIDRSRVLVNPISYNTTPAVFSPKIFSFLKFMLFFQNVTLVKILVHRIRGHTRYVWFGLFCSVLDELGWVLRFQRHKQARQMIFITWIKCLYSCNQKSIIDKHAKNLPQTDQMYIYFFLKTSEHVLVQDPFVRF